MAETELSAKAEILSEIWIDYRDEEEFEDFIEYNDLGLPLAYAYANSIIDLNESTENLISETWDLFLSGFGIEEDIGFETLADVFEFSGGIVQNSTETGTDLSEEDEEDFEYEELEETEQGYAEGFNEGFKKGVAKEQERIQEIVIMQKRWAKENRKGNEFLFWDSVGEVLTPINFEYDEEEYKKSLEADGF